MDRYKKQIAEQVKKINESLSPAQKSGLDAMLSGAIEDSPNNFVKAMHYGGDYTIDDDCKMVEMNGDFSKADLVKIAAVMID